MKPVFSDAPADGEAQANERALIQQTEQALRANDAPLALDASGAGTWSWEVASNMVTWDDRYHALYEFGAHEPRSREAWLTRVHPDDRPRITARIRKLLEPGAGDRWDEEFRAALPSGAERWIGGLGRVERDRRGRAVRFRGIDLDITARKQCEQTLILAVSRLRSTLDSTADGLLVVDAGGPASRISTGSSGNVAVAR